MCIMEIELELLMPPETNSRRAYVTIQGHPGDVKGIEQLLWDVLTITQRNERPQLKRPIEP